ncbi:MAG: hypothetical protein AB1414_11480 [bacterium]
MKVTSKMPKKANSYQLNSNTLIVISILIVVFTSHVYSIVITSLDSSWIIPTAESIIKEGNTDLNEYMPRQDYRIENIKGHYYTKYPIGAIVIAVPFVYLIDKILTLFLSPEISEIIKAHYYYHGEDIASVAVCRFAEILIASLIIAVASIFIYLISRGYLNNRYSLLLTFIFAFCTSTWSTASRALWPHGPSILLLTISLYIILLSQKKPHLLQYVGLPLSFSFIVRPTNSLSIIIITTYIFLYHRKYFIKYILGTLIITIPFLIYNFSIYHNIISPYYLDSKICLSPYFFEALSGNLVSPSRGLFIFSPVLLFSIYGLVLKSKEKPFDILTLYIFMIIILHWIMISSRFPIWWGGHAFGQRHFSDMIPYFIYLLIPFIKKLNTLKGKIKICLNFIFMGLIILSFFIQFKGANDWNAFLWNATPVNIDIEPKRIWDWKDIQFLR